MLRLQDLVVASVDPEINSGNSIVETAGNSIVETAGSHRFPVFFTYHFLNSFQDLVVASVDPEINSGNSNVETAGNSIVETAGNSIVETAGAYRFPVFHFNLLWSPICTGMTRAAC